MQRCNALAAVTRGCVLIFFFFNDTATTETYTLSLHDALPIWLAKIVERGMISSSFVPPEPIRRLRTHTRYRRHLTQARTAEKQRVEKLLEDGHLKLSSVISDIHGVSGRDMLDAIAAGQRDPRALAQLARGKMRGKFRRLEEALACSLFTEEHTEVLAIMMVTI